MKHSIDCVMCRSKVVMGKNEGKYPHAKRVYKEHEMQKRNKKKEISRNMKRREKKMHDINKEEEKKKFVEKCSYSSDEMSAERK